ncbi:MAG: hypothetical protein IKW14_00740 [Phascolarctobacterium sp.]|nr:hypothetical protein [Phascolarctobacterium sp.]
MSIKGKVKMMFRCSGKSLDNLAVHRGTSVPVVRNLLARGQSRLKPFLEICTYCGYKVTLENKDLGITIPLTLEDITEDEKYNANLKYVRSKQTGKPKNKTEEE